MTLGLNLRKFVACVLLSYFLGVVSSPIKVEASERVSCGFSVADLCINIYDLSVRNLYRDCAPIRGSASIYKVVRKSLEIWDCKPVQFVRGVFCVPAVLNCFANDVKWIKACSNYFEIASAVPSLCGGLLMVAELAVVPLVSFGWYTKSWQANANVAVTKRQTRDNERSGRISEWIENLK